MTLLQKQDSNLFNLMLQQQNQQQEFQIEKNLEEHYLFVLALTDKDVCLSDLGKDESRSITSQINNWKKEMADQEQNSNFLFISLENSYEKFKKYVLGKYSGKKADKWKLKFDNEGFVTDVKRLLITRIYRHKYELAMNGKGGFFSGQAHNQMQLIETYKHVRSLAHEAANRTVKYIDKKPQASRMLTRGDFDMIAEIIESVVDEKIQLCLPNRANKQDLPSIIAPVAASLN